MELCKKHGWGDGDGGQVHGRCHWRADQPCAAAVFGQRLANVLRIQTRRVGARAARSARSSSSSGSRGQGPRLLAVHPTHALGARISTRLSAQHLEALRIEDFSDAEIARRLGDLRPRFDLASTIPSGARSGSTGSIATPSSTKDSDECPTRGRLCGGGLRGTGDGLRTAVGLGLSRDASAGAGE